MTKTPYYDAYMRGERSSSYEWKTLMRDFSNFKTLRMNDYQYSIFPGIFGTYSEDWRYDD